MPPSFPGLIGRMPASQREDEGDGELKPRCTSRRKFMRCFIQMGGCPAWLGAVYAWWIERVWVRTLVQSMPFRGLAPAFDRYRLAQISDLVVNRSRRHISPGASGRISGSPRYARPVDSRRPHARRQGLLPHCRPSVPARSAQGVFGRPLRTEREASVCEPRTRLAESGSVNRPPGDHAL